MLVLTSSVALTVQGRAIFASGSPFAPVEYNDKLYASGQVEPKHPSLKICVVFCVLNFITIFMVQANNAYVFPGFGLGLIISGAIRVHDDMLLAACEFL